MSAGDAVILLSAGGRTPYVLGAEREARAAGALTVGVVCVRDSELGRVVEHEVAAVVGPEVITGSTRMKAGTAQARPQHDLDGRDGQLGQDVPGT